MQRIPDHILADVVSLASDAIICCDATQRIIFFNDGARTIFGHEPAAVLGQPLDLLLPERARAAHRAHMTGFAHSPIAARRMGERSLIAGRRLSGEEFPAEAAITRFDMDTGPIFAVVLRDVTKQRQADLDTKRVIADMEEAVRARDEMLGLVTHDLRNPVNAVKMLAAAILRVDDAPDSPPLPPVVVEHAAVMLQAASQMDTLIQDLLDVTRLELGRMRLTPQMIRAVDLVEVAIDTLAPLAAARRLRLDATVSTPVETVQADPDRILQVLSNLIGNAVKFTPAGGRVDVHVVSDGDAVRFTVQDTGPGIPPDELPRVFDRFWQSKRTNRSGAGLGLAIARGLIQAHGGRIWVESTLNEGTAVHFTLPLGAAPVPVLTTGTAALA
jgi:PAS domain S-box-containing protein